MVWLALIKTIAAQPQTRVTAERHHPVPHSRARGVDSYAMNACRSGERSVAGPVCTRLFAGPFGASSFCVQGLSKTGQSASQDGENHLVNVGLSGGSL